MIIDCGSCVARHTTACRDCLVTALLGDTGVIELGDDEHAAIDAMASAGLIAPLRLVIDDGARRSEASG